QVADNLLRGRPLGEHVGRAATLSAATGAALEPLQRILPAARDPRLVHLTSAEGEAGIRESGQVIGRKGIFAVPESAADQSVAVRVARTGLTPNKATNVVPLPD